MYLQPQNLKYAGELSRLDGFDPRCRVICALFLTSALAALHSLSALLAGSLIPAVLFFMGDRRSLTRLLANINASGIFMCVLLVLTYPGEQKWGLSLEGCRIALLVLLKLNLISITMLRMVASMGMGRLDPVLAYFRIPRKLRILILMMLRHVFLLMERFSTMSRAIFLRAPALKGRNVPYVFACMVGTTLIHSADRAERQMLAIRCRGRFDGFLQYAPMAWALRDTLLCAVFILYITGILGISIFWRV